MTNEDRAGLERRCLELLALARVYVVRKAPYLSSILYSLVPVMSSIGSVAVTKDHLLVVDPNRVVNDPELSELTNVGGGELPAKLGGVLAHECMHLLRGIERVQELAIIDKETANKAADLPINADLRRADWELPSWGIYPETYDLPEGQTMEWYFNKLREAQQDSSEEDSGSKSDSNGGSGSDSSGSGDDGDSSGSGGSSSDSGQQGGKPDVCSGRCGSAAGNPAPGEPTPGSQEAGLGRSQEEVNSARRNSVQALKKYYAGVGRGDCPGWVEEALQDILNRERTRNWERELSTVVRRTSGIAMTGASDFSLKRPSKRTLLRGGLLRPGLIDRQYVAAMAIDSSGSMGRDQLNYAKSVVCDVMRQTGIDEVWLAQCDARVTREFIRTRIREIPDMPIKGRGGTDFRPIFDSLSSLRPRPDVLVVITDGDGPAPDEAPHGVAVVWVIVPSQWQRKPAEWGHLIVCTNDPDVADTYLHL